MLNVSAVLSFPVPPWIQMHVFCHCVDAQFMACGTVASSRCVCIALKRKVIVYEITKLMARYTRLKVCQMLLSTRNH